MMRSLRWWQIGLAVAAVAVVVALLLRPRPQETVTTVPVEGGVKMHMWVLKPHYYSSHFYNWPYTYGLLFGLGLFAKYREDPDRFRDGYDDLLSRAGMNTAEQLGAAFGLDVTDEAFWHASTAVIADRIAQYDALALDPAVGGTVVAGGTP